MPKFNFISYSRHFQLMVTNFWPAVYMASMQRPSRMLNILYAVIIGSLRRFPLHYVLFQIISGFIMDGNVWVRLYKKIIDNQCRQIDPEGDAIAQRIQKRLECSLLFCASLQLRLILHPPVGQTMRSCNLLQIRRPFYSRRRRYLYIHASAMARFSNL